MSDFRESDEALASDIAYALWRSPFRLRRGRQLLDDCKLVAPGVVEHLKRCGWRFVRNPPAPPHSSSHYMGGK